MKLWKGWGDFPLKMVMFPLKMVDSHGKSPFLIGKPSISMGHLYHVKEPEGIGN